MRLEISNIKSLPKTNRMGLTCANINGELLFIWGGTSDRDLDRLRAANQLDGGNPDLWIYDTLTGYWRHRTCSGECPPHLSGSTSSLVGHQMLVFGGHSTAHDNWINGLYSLDLNTFEWTDLGSRALAEPTKPICSDKCTSWTHKGKLYVFGGYGWSQTEHLLELLDLQKDLQLMPDFRWPKFGWNNQLVEFDPRDNTWRWPSYSGSSPSARAAHAGTLVGDTYFLFGGRDWHERLNDLYTLDMRTFTWSKVAVIAAASSSVPSVLMPRPSNLSPSSAEHTQSPSPPPQPTSTLATNQQQQPSTSQASTSEPANPSTTNPQANKEPEEVDTDSLLDTDYGASSSRLMVERWSLASDDSPDAPSLRLSQQVRANSGENTPDARPAEPVINHSQPEQQQLYNQAFVREDQAVEIGDEAPREQDDITHPDDAEGCSIPIGRSFCSFTPISSRQIALYGGISSQGKILDDCWLFDTLNCSWTQMDLKIKQPRLWHSGAKTKNNELIIIGGSSSNKVDEFCSDVLTISLEAKSLKRLSLDSVARSIRMQTLINDCRLPPTIRKLVMLRKQAIALTMHRQQAPQKT